MLLVDEKYYGSKKDYDSTIFFEWMQVIKTNFNKFIKYFLPVEGHELKEKLEFVSKFLGEKYDFGIQENFCIRIKLTDDYLVFNYPIYDESDEAYHFNVVIISRDYSAFYFVDTHDNIAHEVETFIVNKGEVQKYHFQIKKIYHYFIDESLNRFLKNTKIYTLK